MKRYTPLFESYEVGHITTRSDNTKWKKFGKGDWRQVVDGEKSVKTTNEKPIEKKSKEEPVDKEKEESKEKLQKKAFKPRKYWSPTFVKNIKEHRKQIDVNVDEKIVKKQIEQKYTKDSEPIIQKFKNISEKIKENPTVVRFHADDSILEGLLSYGRTKNLFETGKGGYGQDDVEQRKDWEDKIYNGATSLKKQVTNKERPTYGMVLTPEAKKNNMGIDYGKHYFVCKNHIKERTTFTMGDSAYIPNTTSTFVEDNIFSIFRDKNLKADHIRLLANKADECNLGHTFIESQIHGQLNLLDDVDHVVFDKSKAIPIPPTFKKICVLYKIKCISPDGKVFYGGKGVWK